MLVLMEVERSFISLIKDIMLMIVYLMELFDVVCFCNLIE